MIVKSFMDINTTGSCHPLTKTQSLFAVTSVAPGVGITTRRTVDVKRMTVAPSASSAAMKPSRTMTVSAGSLGSFEKQGEVAIRRNTLRENATGRVERFAKLGTQAIGNGTTMQVTASGTIL